VQHWANKSLKAVSLLYVITHQFRYIFLHLINRSEVFLCKRVVKVNDIKLSLTLQRTIYLQKKNKPVFETSPDTFSVDQIAPTCTQTTTTNIRQFT